MGLFYNQFFDPPKKLSKRKQAKKDRSFALNQQEHDELFNRIRSNQAKRQAERTKAYNDRYAAVFNAKDNETMKSELKRVRDMEHEGIKDSGKKSKSSSDYTDYSEDTQASPYISDENLLNLYDSVSDLTLNFSPESGYSLQFVDDNHDLQIIPITEDQYELIKAHLDEQMSSMSLFENLF